MRIAFDVSPLSHERSGVNNYILGSLRGLVRAAGSSGDEVVAFAPTSPAGRRVIAIGTTTTRVLETIADPVAPDAGRTSILLQPGVPFRTVGALVTNFHLPRTTLLALVMAFAGVEATRNAYRVAIEERYRFYSFGDAMLIL